MTQRCVQSVLDAGYPPVRIFCFDNGSLPENHDRVSAAFPDVNHIRIPENRGYSGGFNGALKWVFRSGYSSAMFCTNDTSLQPGGVEACESAGKLYNAGLVAPCIYHASHTDSIDSTAGYFNPDTATLHHYRTENLPPILGRYDYVPGTALWIQRDAFESLTGTDESFHTFWEDADLSFRAWTAGIPMARSYQARILHGVGRTCHKKPLYTTYYFQRNRILFCRRHLKGDKQDSALVQIKEDLSVLEASWCHRKDSRRLNYLEKLRSELNI